jgi:tRNA-dihydrouridine synthase
MNVESQNKEPQIYLAPLQGFTDVVYRNAYNDVFTGIDAFFIPYISVKNKQVLNKYAKEIRKENNQQKRVIPQLLAKNADELLFLSDFLVQEGYSEINLNLGCPYPMVTNRGQGAGLLPHPEKIEEMLKTFYTKFSIKLSVKMRAGLNSVVEIKNVIPVLNDFPLNEIILHPRIAKQLYTGTIDLEIFRFASEKLQHKLIYNGDIFSVSDFERVKNHFPETNGFMLGRGVLQNPFLPAEIKNLHPSNNERQNKLIEFHQLVLTNYIDRMDNEGNVLNKMKQFWIYFGNNFTNREKLLKRIKKIRSLSDYKTEINSKFTGSSLIG